MEKGCLLIGHEIVTLFKFSFAHSGGICTVMDVTILFLISNFTFPLPLNSHTSRITIKTLRILAWVFKPLNIDICAIIIFIFSW